MNEFNGAKAALYFENNLVVYLRDNKPEIPFPNTWDFPGGRREGDESPFECVARETQEEFGILLTPTQIIWKKTYPSIHDPSKDSCFFVARATKEQIDNIVFGDEGQWWRFMDPQKFLDSTNAVPYLQEYLAEFMAEAA